MKHRGETGIEPPRSRVTDLGAKQGATTGPGGRGATAKGRGPTPPPSVFSPFYRLKVGTSSHAKGPTSGKQEGGGATGWGTQVCLRRKLEVEVNVEMTQCGFGKVVRATDDEGFD